MSGSVSFPSVICIYLQSWWQSCICSSRFVCVLGFKRRKDQRCTLETGVWLCQMFLNRLSTLWGCTFADRALLSHHSIGVDVGDVDWQIPPPAAHPTGNRHTERIMRLLQQSHRLLVTRRLLARILEWRNGKWEIHSLKFCAIFQCKWFGLWRVVIYDQLLGTDWCFPDATHKNNVWTHDCPKRVFVINVELAGCCDTADHGQILPWIPSKNNKHSR